VKAAWELAVPFIEMIRERRAERVNGWIDLIVESRIPELKSFADSLKQDQAAPVSALTHEWSEDQAPYDDQEISKLPQLPARTIK